MKLGLGRYYHTPDGNGYLVHDNGRGMVRVKLKDGAFVGDERTFRARDLEPIFDPAAYELDTDTPVDPLDSERAEDIYSDAVLVIEEKLVEARAEVERLLLVQRALRDGRKGE